MSVELVKLCDPDAYYDQFISKGIYPDGRPIHAFSAISFKNGGYGGIGSAIVQQGGITVCCTISAEICLENDGPLVIPRFEGASDISENILNDVLDTLNEVLSLKEVLPRSALRCKGTEDSVPLMWRLTITIRVLNGGGSLCDAVVGAVNYALASIQLPHIKLTHAKEDESPIEKSEISVLPEKSHLLMADVPVCSTFAIYKTTTLNEDKSVVLSDPPTEILSLCSTKCTVVAGRDRILSFKLHGFLSDNNLLNNIFEMAIGRQQTVSKALKV